jgi:hypothetical protein
VIILGFEGLVNLKRNKSAILFSPPPQFLGGHLWEEIFTFLLYQFCPKNRFSHQRKSMEPPSGVGPADVFLIWGIRGPERGKGGREEKVLPRRGERYQPLLSLASAQPQCTLEVYFRVSRIYK